MVINTQSSPQPYYNPSSILLTLEAFSGAFTELRGMRSNVKTKNIHENALGPNPAHTDAVHHFAEILSWDILDAAVRKQDTQSSKNGDRICNITESEVSEWTMSEQEKLANRLTAEIYSNALEELAKHACSAGGKSKEHHDVIQTKQTYEKEIITEIHNESASYLWSSMQHCNQEGLAMETGWNMYQRRSSTNSTPLDNMAKIGSLDYPDAPPSTPLVPEMMRSRASFTRKLKGGLAKEFLPETPPPTPKDQQSLLMDKMTDSTVEKSEFMIRLMRSLSLACSQIEEDNGENRLQSEISDYAAQLSTDIIHCITASQADSGRNIEKPFRDVDSLADHLTHEIIMTSVAEVMRNKKEDRTSQEIPYFENTTQALNDTLLSDSVTDIPSVEALKAMASRLITNILVQALSKLGSGSFQNTTSKQISDPASEPVPWEQESDQYLNTGFHAINCHQIQSNGCSNMKSEWNYTPLDTSTEKVEHVFAENIVHEVLKCSIKEASNCHLRCKRIPVHLNRPSSSEEIRAFISETLCHDIQELQCLLLWAAASQMETSSLQIEITDEHIQQQVCRLKLHSNCNPHDILYHIFPFMLRNRIRLKVC